MRQNVKSKYDISFLNWPDTPDGKSLPKYWKNYVDQHIANTLRKPQMSISPIDNLYLTHSAFKRFCAQYKTARRIVLPYSSYKSNLSGRRFAKIEINGSQILSKPTINIAMETPQIKTFAFIHGSYNMTFFLHRQL